ncbi:MAG: hypothetical protein GY722_10550, partial [bacterium]|nr:hypothetical protein [bacterium]
PLARLTLPNVERLAPGEVTEMYSFDHDLGHFVSIGPATTSDDGMVMRSDPGVGIVKAGWHCGGNPASTGTPHACPQCQVCDGSTCVAGGTGCSLDDPCMVNERCEGGVCVGDERRVITVDATANGQDMPVVDMLESVTFQAVVEHENCDSLAGAWDFDAPDMPLKAQSTLGPFTFTYDTPGTHRYTVDVDCNDGCDEDGDRGAVLVRCPEVRIIGTDPPVAYLCPTCSMTIQAQTSPPDLPLEWEIAETTELNVELMDLGDGSARLLANNQESSGEVIVKVNVRGAEEQCPERAVDEISIFVFEPPDFAPKFNGLTAKQIIILKGLLRVDQERLVCLAELLAIQQTGFAATFDVFNRFAPGCSTRDGTAANAFLHAFVNCRTAAVCGEGLAKAFWDAHEDNQGNKCFNAFMDFHNNEVGRQLAVPALPELCQQRVTGALDAGRLRWKTIPDDESPCPVVETDSPPGDPCRQ